MALRSVFFALLAVLSGTLSARSAPSNPDLAFDQITRVIIKGTAPPPGSFAADAARIAALPPLPSAPRGSGFATSAGMSALAAIPGVGLLAGIAQEAAAIAYAKSAQTYSAAIAAAGQARMNAGEIQHAWYSGVRSRLDTDATHAGIVKNDATGEVFYLDLASKTYRVQRPLSAAGETYVISDPSSQTAAAVVSMQSGQIANLPGTVLSGLKVRGFRATASFTTASSTAWCPAGSHQLDEVEYVSDTADPQSTGNGEPMTIEQIAAEACNPTTAQSHYESGRFYLFRSTALTRSFNGDDAVFVTERGNVRALAYGEDSVFQIPAGFTMKEGP